MPLNLTDVDGCIQRITTSKAGEGYQVFPKHPAFPWITHVCLSLSAMSSAISTLRGLTVSEGDYLGLTCIALEYKLRIPLSGCVECALRNENPAFIEIAVHWGRSPEHLEIWALPLKTWLNNIIWPGFIDFVERRDLKLRSSELKRLVDILRNAYAHGGIIQWPDRRPPISWHGISLDSSSHNRNVHEILGYSDVLALMLLISNEILLPHAVT